MNNWHTVGSGKTIRHTSTRHRKRKATMPHLSYRLPVDTDETKWIESLPLYCQQCCLKSSLGRRYHSKQSRLPSALATEQMMLRSQTMTHRQTRIGQGCDSISNNRIFSAAHACQSASYPRKKLVKDHVTFYHARGKNTPPDSKNGLRHRTLTALLSNSFLS
jgi:hypothetical protein